MVRADAAASLRPGPGIEGGRIVLATTDGLAALISQLASDRVRPSRANLLAHQGVVEATHARATVLPVRFGTVVPDRDALVAELLTPGRKALRAALDEVEGKDEFRVKAAYLPGVALAEVVRRDRGVQRLRAQQSRSGRAVGQADRLELGRRVVRGLADLRSEDAASIEKALAGVACMTARLPERGEDAAAHLALLVDRRHHEDLSQAAERLASANAHRLSLEMIGPLPAWDFSQIDWEAG